MTSPEFKEQLREVITYWVVSFEIADTSPSFWSFVFHENLLSKIKNSSLPCELENSWRRDFSWEVAKRPHSWDWQLLNNSLEIFLELKNSYKEFVLLQQHILPPSLILNSNIQVKYDFIYTSFDDYKQWKIASRSLTHIMLYSQLQNINLSKKQ